MRPSGQTPMVPSGGNETATTLIMRIPSTDSKRSVGRFEDARALAYCSPSYSLIEEREPQERGGFRHLKGRVYEWLVVCRLVVLV